MAWHGTDAPVLRLAAAAVMPVVATSSTAASTSEAVCSLDWCLAIDFVHAEGTRATRAVATVGTTRDMDKRYHAHLEVRRQVPDGPEGPGAAPAGRWRPFVTKMRASEGLRTM